MRIPAGAGGAVLPELQQQQAECRAGPAGTGVPCSAVLDTLDLFTDPQLVERGLVHRLQHPEAGEIAVMGSPIRMSESEVALTAAPALGEHTAEVLRQELGLGDAELERLRGVAGFAGG